MQIGIAGVALLAVFGAGLIAPASAVQGTGSIAGTVVLTEDSAVPLPTSAYGRRGVAPRPVSAGAETRKVVVYLDGLKPATAPPAMSAAIAQQSEQFLPPVTALTIGSTVAFPNEDPFFHNVFSLSRVATFDLGRYPPGESRSRQFLRPGVVKVFCHIHSQMSALILVLDHPWFTLPEETGTFTLAAVPPGDHTLVAWHERIGERRERVHVTPGVTTRVSFTLPVLEPKP